MCRCGPTVCLSWSGGSAISVEPHDTNDCCCRSRPFWAKMLGPCSEAVSCNQVVLGFSKGEAFAGFCMFLSTAALEAARSCLSWTPWSYAATVGIGGSYLFCYLGFPAFPHKDSRNWPYPSCWLLELPTVGVLFH